jgi:hypothetical protein
MNLTEKEISYLIQGLNEYKLVIGLAKSKQRNRLKIKNPTGFNLNLKEQDQKDIDEVSEKQHEMNDLIKKLTKEIA